MKKGKKFLLLHVLSEIKKGKSPAKISKENNISKQNLNYYLRQLRQSGKIQKISYGIWEASKEVKKTTKAHKAQHQIRGHAFNWKIRFNHEIDWKRRLDKFNLPYQLIGINKSTPRIIFNEKKIWFTKTGLVIYEPKSFFSQSSHTSKGMAVFELDKTIKEIGRKLQISLEHYQFTTSREHYGMIKNELARQYNNKKEKLYIKEGNSVWMWIDDSHSLAELETNEPILSKNIQDWYNDHKATAFKVTPTFTLNSINQVTQNQLMFNKNFESHVGAIQELGSSVRELTNQVKILQEENKKLRDRT